MKAVPPLGRKNPAQNKEQLSMTMTSVIRPK